MTQATTERRLPFGKKPLRNPGQSLEEQLNAFQQDRLMLYFIIITFLSAFVAAEWFRWLVGDRFRPVAFTVIALACGAFAWWRIRRVIQDLRDLKAGLVGERHTGQFLQNALLRHGYWIVHDIPEDGFNIDHALIGPGGVFAIETKTRRKGRGESRIAYDGGKVLVDGLAPDRDPVAQAKGAARRLQEILLEKTGTRVFVRPVVLFPGWYVEKQPAGVETWVLNEKAFAKFVENEPQQQSKEQAFVLAAALGSYVRDRQEKLEGLAK